MGRKSRYDSEVKPHIAEIRKAVESGATVAEIAEAFGIGLSTLHRYMAEKQELRDAFSRGRKKIIFDIKGALLKKALGYEYQEKKQYMKKDEDGEKVTYTEFTTRHQPPSETAAAMLLRNYDPEWLDKDNISTELRKQEIELKKAIAKDNAFDIEL